MAVIIVVILVIGVLIGISIASSDPSEGWEKPPVPPPSYQRRVKWEKNHFINQRLHMNDARRERHRREQGPWW